MITRVKLVIMMSSAGAMLSSVKAMMISRLSLGFVMAFPRLIDTDPDPDPDAAGADGAAGAGGVGASLGAAVVGVPAGGIVVNESGTVIDGEAGIVTAVVGVVGSAAAGRVDPMKLRTMTAATVAHPAHAPSLDTRARRPVAGRDRPRIRGMAAVRPGER
jgi:hypothetical protein